MTIVSLTGKADDFDLVFERKGEGWEAKAPPDLSDGQYAVTLCAVYDTGASTVHRGMLYLCAGIRRVELGKERLFFRLLPAPYKIRIKECGRRFV